MYSTPFNDLSSVSEHVAQHECPNISYDQFPFRQNLAVHQAYQSYGVSTTPDLILPTNDSIGGYLTTQGHDVQPAPFATGSATEQGDGLGNLRNFQPSTIPSMAPPPVPRKRKAPTLTAADWEPYKQDVLDLHVTQGLTLPEVREKMIEKRGFIAEVKQYRTFISQWRKDKNAKRDEMTPTVQKKPRRKLNENNIPHNSLYSTNSTASTSSKVDCNTTSGRDSPTVNELVWPSGIAGITTQGSQLMPATPAVSGISSFQDIAFLSQSLTPAHQSLSILNESLREGGTGVSDQTGTKLNSLPQRCRQEEEEQLRDQLYRAEKALEPSPDQTAAILTKLVKVLVDQGRHRTAEEACRLLVESHRSRKGDFHSDTLCSLSNLGEILHGQGLHAQSFRIQKRALKGLEKAVGREHTTYFVVAFKIGVLSTNLGKYQEAEGVLHESLQRRSNLYGLGDTLTLQSYQQLGCLMIEKSQYKQAEEILRPSLELMDEARGWSDLDTLASAKYLGWILHSLGKVEEARSIEVRVAKVCETLYGSEHPGLLGALYTFSATLRVQNRFGEAEMILRRILDAEKKVLGQAHASTIRTKKDLEAVLRKQGRFEEAEGLA